MREFLGQARETCVNGGVEYRQVATDQPFEQAILDFLTLRSGGGAVDQPGVTWNS